jgi:CheY-specific phosphatase CheX
MATSESQLLIFFQDAIQETFSKMLGTSVEFTLIDVQKERVSDLDVLSVIGLKSSDYTGSASIGFSSLTFLNILEKLLGEKATELTSENCDASGELLNIIYCSARKNINEKNLNFESAIPSTVIGKNLSIANAGICFSVLGKSGLGEFEFAFCLRSVNKVFSS